MSKRRNLAAGLTLVEILTAVSILSVLGVMVFSFYLFVNRQILERQKKFLSFQSRHVFVGAVKENIRQCRRSLGLGEHDWVFVKSSRDTASYSGGEGKIMYNGKEVIMQGGAVTVSFTCFGADSTMDLNNDGDVSFKELDTDSDGMIAGDECLNIRRIRVTLVTEDGDSLWAEESVKNRL